MRKIQSGIINAAQCIAVVFLLASCRSEDNVIDTTGKSDNRAISFIVKEEPFSSEVEYKPGSRTVGEPIAAKTVDLGDGLQAEVSLQDDDAEDETSVDKAPKTRAPLSNDRYFIYAINEATSMQAGETITGTVKDQVFIPDATSPHLSLAPGTYTFVCGTVDGIQNDGSMRLFVSAGHNTMVGVTKHVNVSGDEMKVSFTMKHQTARIRFKIVAYTPQIRNATIKLTSEYMQSSVFYYAVELEMGSSNAFGEIDTEAKNVEKNPVGTDGKFVQANTFMTEYEYLLPDVRGNDLTLNFISGTAYGNVNLAGKKLLLDVLNQTQRNKSYTIQVKLKPTPALYLFQDGTCGVLAEKGTRTPIGIVVTEKTASGKGLAAALNFTPNVIWEQDNPPAGSGNSYQNNKVCYPNPNAGLADMNGYNWTWDAASSLDGKVRGDEQTKYPAFYVAGHYNPGVTVTGANVGKWFLPSWGQLMEFFKLTAKDLTMPTAGPAPSNPWFGANPTFSDSRALEKLNNYIIQAGGNRFDQSFISTSTQVDGTPTVRRYQPAGCTLNVGSGTDRIQVFAIWKTMHNGGVLPFVHF